ncbi:hypothetical protein [Pilimelia columellifera]|uniref:Uncharacterized protein n=1 Tax=Pilimelia columellifera subsp. columellifera TaxID=706583 RepID=A0ABP6AR85_9ACTN
MELANYADGVDLIVGALVAGGVAAVTDTATAATREALDRLRSRLITLFRGDQAALAALQGEMTEAQAVRQLLEPHLLAAGAVDDPEVVQAARQMLISIHGATNTSIDARFSKGAMFGGVGNTQNVTIN